MIARNPRAYIPAMTAWALLQAMSPAMAGNAAAGHAIAVELCSPCHAIGTEAASPAPPSPARTGPPFAHIAERATTTRESLRQFLTDSHDGSAQPVGMPNPHLTSEQIADVSAFILTLRRAD